MKNKPRDNSQTFQQQWEYFGELLRDRRDAAGMSRLDLARKARLSEATIKFIETARNRPSRTTLIRLLGVAELRLTWAEVPGHHKPPAEKPDTPTPSPQAPQESREPGPDPAQFFMNLIGFDEIRLPVGAPKTLRIFQKRHRIGEEADEMEQPAESQRKR